MTPVLNKLLTIQLIIQEKVEGIVFDNNAKGFYDKIISGIALACLKQIHYLSNSVHMMGFLWAQLVPHTATGYGVSVKTYSSCTGLDKGMYISNLWTLLN
jgi:hypothetical protein